MTQFVFILLAIVQVTVFAAIIAEAAVNYNDEDIFQCEIKKAIKTSCAVNCEIDKCPEHKNYSRKCDKSKCTPGCECGFNEKFSKNGTCVATQLCPPFQCDLPNEEYVACPSYCSEACFNGCPTFGFILMAVECMPECRCKEGFRRKSGVCVNIEEC